MRLTLEEAFALEKELNRKPQKGTKKVNLDEYIIVPQRFIRLNISCKELLAFCLIYSICCNCESHTFTASNNYVATRINCNIPYANRVLKSLLQRGLIVKVAQNNNSGTCTYILPDNLDEICKKYIPE